MDGEFNESIGDTNNKPQFTFYYCQKVSIADVLRLVEERLPGAELEKVYLLPTMGCTITPDTSFGVDAYATHKKKL